MKKHNYENLYKKLTPESTLMEVLLEGMAQHYSDNVASEDMKGIPTSDDDSEMTAAAVECILDMLSGNFFKK